MSYLAGFQPLEQRDSEDMIVAEGVVSKKSPFATADNEGIYDVIAEDLRYLYEELTNIASSNDLASIRDEVKKMYNTMTTDSNFGQVEAKAQADIATEQAQIATDKAKEAADSLSSLLKAKTSINDDLVTLQDTVKAVKDYLATIGALKESVQSNTTVAQNKAKEATERASDASNSATNAMTWAQGSDSPDNAEDSDSTTGKTMSAKSWAMFSKAEADKSKTSETNAKTSEDNAKTSETNAKTSEDNAKTSETNAKESETNAQNSENNAREAEVNCGDMMGQTQGYMESALEHRNMAQKWAEGEIESETITDKNGNETIIVYKSAKAWATESKNSADSSSVSAGNAKTSETNAKTSENNASSYQKQAKESLDSAKKSEANAKSYSETSVTHATNARNSASSAKESENMAQKWAESGNSPDGEFDADNSTGHTLSAKGWAKVAKGIADTTKTYENNTKGYMDSAKASVAENKAMMDNVKSLQSNTDSLHAQTQALLKEAKTLKDSMSNAVSYCGTVLTYADLPTDNRIGDMYCIKNADSDHDINANDKVIWNGTTWDNTGGGVDIDAFAKLGKDADFKKVTAESFVGELDGNAKTADKAKSVEWSNVIGRPEKFIAEGGRADTANVCTGNAATASKASKAICDENGNNIAETYVDKNSLNERLGDFESGILNVIKPKTSCAVGEIYHSPYLPSYCVLECIQAGTTGEGELM